MGKRACTLHTEWMSERPFSTCTYQSRNLLEHDVDLKTRIKGKCEVGWLDANLIKINFKSSQKFLLHGKKIPLKLLKR